MSFFAELWRRLEVRRQQIENSNVTMGLFKQVVRDGIATLERDPETIVRQGCPPEVLPKREHLQRLITEAFWASLERDEDRPLNFKIVYRLPFNDDGGQALKKRLTFDRQIIPKLPAAFRSATFSIGVTVSCNG